MTRVVVWKGNMKKETESLLMAAQNKTTMTNYADAKIHNTLEKSKWYWWYKWNS